MKADDQTIQIIRRAGERLSKGYCTGQYAKMKNGHVAKHAHQIYKCCLHGALSLETDRPAPGVELVWFFFNTAPRIRSLVVLPEEWDAATDEQRAAYIERMRTWDGVASLSMIGGEL